MGFPKLIKKDYLYAAVMSYTLQPFIQRTGQRTPLPSLGGLAVTSTKQLRVCAHLLPLPGGEIWLKPV